MCRAVVSFLIFTGKTQLRCLRVKEVKERKKRGSSGVVGIRRNRIMGSLSAFSTNNKLSILFSAQRRDLVLIFRCPPYHISATHGFSHLNLARKGVWAITSLTGSASAFHCTWVYLTQGTHLPCGKLCHHKWDPLDTSRAEVYKIRLTSLNTNILINSMLFL